MFFNEKGQTFQFDGKTFTVGGTVLQLHKERPVPLGTVLSINAEDTAHPMAQCGYEDRDPKCLPLEQLVSVSSTVPEEAGRQYALYYNFDCSEGQQVDVLGISSDKSVLIRLMLDVERDESETSMMVCAGADPEKDTLHFYYQCKEKTVDPFYLEYVIKPVPVYPGCKGGIGV